MKATYFSIVNRETIGQEVNNPEMAILDYSSVNERDFHQHKRLVQTSASSRLGISLAVVCFQSFLLLWEHTVLFWIVI